MIETNFLNDTISLVIPIHRRPEVTALDELHMLNNIAMNFALNLWRVRDNCVNVNVGYMFENDNGSFKFHKRNIRSYFFNHEGHADVPIKFSYKEMKDAFDLAFASFAHSGEGPATHGTRRTKGLERQSRFLLWVHDARKQDDLLTRISLYITALEALLSTSNSELSHQLSERVAYFLPGVSKPERLDHYKKMKRCYGLRSKGLHGDVLKPTEIDILEELSGYLDEVCRAFTNETFNNNEFADLLISQERIVDSFNTRLFG